MSPISEYFKGHGSQVMADMKKKNGDQEGESEFYATANSRPGMKPASDGKKKRGVASKIMGMAG